MLAFAPYLITALIYILVAADFWRSAGKPPSGQSLRWHAVMIAVGLLVLVSYVLM